MTRSLLLALAIFVLLDIARSLRRLAYINGRALGEAINDQTVPYQVRRERPPEERN